MRSRRDRDLGMQRRITRRDFLNGTALTIGAALVPPRWLHAAEAYPPALTGLRGSHDGAYEAAHALRDGDFWKTAGAPRDTGERYDLVVVGGGISGLAAAHYFRKAAGASARVLVLDNHDDFGGHARRNELEVGDRTLLSFGGTFSIESPAPYSAVAKALVEELGIDVPSFEKVVDWSVYSSRGLGSGFFFDKETFGVDRLVKEPRTRRQAGVPQDPEAETADWKRFLDEAPLGEAAKRDALRLVSDRKDYLPGLSSDEKKAKLARMSYADYLTKVVGCDRGVLALFDARLHGLYGVGMDGVPAQDAWGFSLPGFAGLGLEPKPGPGMGLDSIPNEEAERYFFHFPDGNATIARLLVRRLVPDAVPGTDAADVVASRARYGRLDVAGAPARVRLGSTVAKVAHVGPAASAREVDVVYVRGGKLESVRASKVVLACWHSVIPYLCPELPGAQREALLSATKVPLLYTSVAIRDWNAWLKLGVSRVHAPNGFHTSVGLDMPVSIGGYHCPRNPGEPIVVHMSKTPCSPGLPARDQHRIGRMSLLSTTFADYEREIRGQLGRVLGPGGFDPARDIAAITVNRWPHGYAYQYNSLFDEYWLTGGETPCERARRPYGRIAIANADAGAYSYTDAAIDHGYRAVQEILGRA